MNSSVRRAFTLPDLVAALGCAATLTVLSSTALSASSRASLTAQDQANLKTLGAAAQQWSADHQGMIVGAPAASARELLNDPRGDSSGIHADIQHSINTDGLATQPFDWASPLAWGYLTDRPAPERRDMRFAYATGVEPVYYDPDAKTPPVATEPPQGALAVLSDPTQDQLSVPYFNNVLPQGAEGTYFTVQTAGSYVAAREFLWWGQGNEYPRWSGEQFWGDAGTFRANTNSDVWLPGRTAGSSNQRIAHARSYRPFVERVGDPSRKIFLANGTRYQSPELNVIDHDISPSGPYGGAFADIGAWSLDLSRAYAEGSLGNGRHIVQNSFRHGDDLTPQGNTLRFDGSVILLTIDEARDPSLWMPRGSSVPYLSIPEALRNDLPAHVEHRPFIHPDFPDGFPAIDRALIW